ncbi:MAG: ferritin-like protein [Herpetosiphon sp.]
MTDKSITRGELFYLLDYAAELEHGLCCQYLYAAFSLKSDPSEGVTWEQLNAISDWAQKILMIARMEMEHLSLVCNLLAALGGAPHMVRPNFPQGALYFPIGFELEKFSEATIKRFICYERPDVVPPGEDTCNDDALLRMAVQRPRETPRVAFETVGELYEKIRQAIVRMPLSDRELFIGPPKAQRTGYDLRVNFPRMGALGGVWDVTLFPITDRKSAVKAIDLILEQGEGTPHHHEFTHYNFFRQILAELTALKQSEPGFEPARNLIANPTLESHFDAPHANKVTNPAAMELMSVFNEAYELLLLLLLRFFGPGDETPNEYTALEYLLFPIMTTVLRPLSEFLVHMPAHEPATDVLAGPSFETNRTIHALPYTESA